jgi:L-ascorbate 6-phosphate lactonase
VRQKHNVPFWESNFREEVESKTIEDGILFWAFGGATFGLRTLQSMLYLDPYFGGDPVECVPDTYRTTAIPLDPAQMQLCDAVLISHEHYDHCHEDTLLAMGKGTKCLFYGPSSAVKEMLSYGISQERIRELKQGDRFRIKDMEITVWPGYDKDEPQAVTYVIDAGGVKIFFGGDGAAGPAFDEIGVKGDLDIAMLAFGRTWYMDESQMLDAAMRLRPKLLLPYHWELWRGHTGDVLELGRLVERRRLPFDVRLLLLGDYLHYRQDGRFVKGR